MHGSPIARLEQSYADTVPGLSIPWRAEAPALPQLVNLNVSLADELDLDADWLRSPEGVAFLVGSVPDDVPTVAQAYAGHQFGGYSPRLGDGRALLLGELVGADGDRRDLHLKGSGRTPFSRGGDGKAALGPMLREVLVGEAMHALGIPTTRALSVVVTGERVFREEGPLPGAVLCRVASSHLRVGTFQLAASLRDDTQLPLLVEYAAARHGVPDAGGDEPLALGLLRGTVERQAALVAQWLLVGFVHGVMNTDNTTISGETIDYGPCAFIEGYDPRAVFSSIDHGGRYAYGNQPAIAQWNLARFAETLVPLIDDDRDAAIAAATDAVTAFGPAYERAYRDGLAAKLGLDVEPTEVDPTLLTDLLELLASSKVDWTRFFRELADGAAGQRFRGADVERFDAWHARWMAAIDAEPGGAVPPRVARRMHAVNPVRIPRNLAVDRALEAATDGDLAPFERLLDAVRRPFDADPSLADLDEPAPVNAPRFVTYCGT